MNHEGSEGQEDRTSSIQSLPSWLIARSEAEHMIERESALVIHQPVVAEQATCRVTDDDVAARAGLVDQVGAESFMRPDHSAAGAGDG